MSMGIRVVIHFHKITKQNQSYYNFMEKLEAEALWLDRIGSTMEGLRLIVWADLWTENYGQNEGEIKRKFIAMLIVM